MRIAFVNRSERTVTDVAFLLKGRDSEWTIADEGRFSVGVRIRHKFGPFDDVDQNAGCDVTSVTFDNGVVWQRS